MATEKRDMVRPEKKRKRKMLGNRQKLLVRSVEEGFRGSWHSGTVIGCENQTRRIQYDHLLSDDGSENLIESINISPFIDGILPSSKMQHNYRGLMRPLPPPLDIGELPLHYGQCVDVYFQDAWWEGVIFDHNDGSVERTIFFPDLGDEMQFGIENIRITLDWNECTEDWKSRGNWVFLDLVKEFKQDWPVPVSMKQIWYEVQTKMGFQKLKEWTCTVKKYWRSLISEVISDNCKLTVNHLFKALDSMDLGDEAQPFSGEILNVMSLEAVGDDDLGCRSLPTDPANAAVPPFAESNCPDDLGLVKVDDRLDKNHLACSNLPCHEETLYLQPPISFNPDEFSLHSNSSAERSPGPCLEISPEKSKRSRGITFHKWQPAGCDMVPRPEYCPGAVTEYLLVFNSKHKPSHHIKLNVRKHLAYLGWKIEFMNDQHFVRLRYVSPDSKTFFSLIQVCKALNEPEAESLPPVSDKGTSAAESDSLSLSPVYKQLHTGMEVSISPPPSAIVVESEICPEAVVEYYLLSSVEKKDSCKLYRDNKLKDVQHKAKKHLSAVGWSFWYTMSGSRRIVQYSSPSGRSFYSLRRACKRCIDEGGLCDNNACVSTLERNIDVIKEAGGQLSRERPYMALTGQEFHVNLGSGYALSEKCLIQSCDTLLPKECDELSKTKVRDIRKLQGKRMDGALSLASPLIERKHQNAGPQTMKRRKASRSLITLRDDLDGQFSTRVMRSTKRARQGAIPSSSYQNPRTVLSWLIDNNVVLPRERVCYLSRKDQRIMAEGRITRDGIKCNCCKQVFTLSKFEGHAGSTYHRPAANIFLEDGRSLLDCQSQLKCCSSTKNSLTEPHHMRGKRHQGINDYICSICHFGGELLLCDRCPSSFHTSCLGLKDVPDGDWFCPSCCCGICGRSGFNRDTEWITDDSILSCDQCEHQYHVGCIRERDHKKIDNYPTGSWFCNERCKQIYLDLTKLLGKSFPVGEDNLTWTLLKYLKSEDEKEISTESFSKLNVALSVMHECFEPVKEPRTKRDLVEDVIFSRWSELNRLNFRGFYTVLLERNDELITAATVRIYGEKVAEVPLVGTRFQYRRLGMCRILMNELEKKLKELGVERLVLPAVPSVLNTWTTSFGFSTMTESERLKFLDYTFLDFQGTVMCQKLLKKIPSTESSLAIGAELNICGSVSKSNNIDLDGNSAISEVFQADQIERSEIVDQGPAEIAATEGGDGGSGKAPLSLLVNKKPTFNSKLCESGIFVECSVESAGEKHRDKKSNSLFKCYKRKRIPAC
ncbi:Histone acetyltransferase [Bertholletia excelsa]